MLKNNVYMKSYLNVIYESVSMSSIKKCRRIADEIGGKYNIKTNSIDCKGNKVRFKNSWLTNGTFNFKLINTSNDWSNMFKYYDCNKLTHLPEDFTIPNTVTNCGRMFTFCNSLTHLPDSFIIPNGVTDCNNMFYNCKSLTHLPDNFTIPNNITDCSFMFGNCSKLTHLPENFHIPKNVIDYSFIFNGCDKLENKDPEAYRMWDI
jgi:hypothetical protein